MKKNISVIAIFSGIGDIDIQRGYGKPKSYRYSWRRAAMVRRAIYDNYIHTCFTSTFGLTEKYRLNGKRK